MRSFLLLTGFALLLSRAAVAQDEPTAPQNMKTGQLSIVVPEYTWLVIEVTERKQRSENQINLYRDGSRVFECNNFNPKQSRHFFTRTAKNTATYQLRGWTKMQDPDSGPPYHPWFPMPFYKKIPDPTKQLMVLEFDNSTTGAEWGLNTTVFVYLYPYKPES